MTRVAEPLRQCLHAAHTSVVWDICPWLVASTRLRSCTLYLTPHQQASRLQLLSVCCSVCVVCPAYERLSVTGLAWVLVSLLLVTHFQGAEADVPQPQGLDLMSLCPQPVPCCDILGVLLESWRS